jgi:hypothetical protein
LTPLFGRFVEVSVVVLLTMLYANCCVVLVCGRRRKHVRQNPSFAENRANADDGERRHDRQRYD